jgi:hypothetical protein
MRERAYGNIALRVALAGMILLLQTCGGSGGDTSSLPAPLTALNPVDGDFDLSTFSQVYQRDVDIFDTMGTGSLLKTVTLRWVVENDDRDVYIALTWEDDTFNNGYDITQGPTDFDGIKVQFDVDGDGTWESGEDGRMLIAATVGSQYIDQHVDSSDETDLIGDGLGKLKYDSVNNVYRAEFLFPMGADAEGQDGDLTSRARYNFTLFDHFELSVPSGNVGYAYGAGTDSSGWPDLPLTQAGPHAHPELPANLTGLMVFISEHEEAKGEIYSFNPGGQFPYPQVFHIFPYAG